MEALLQARFGLLAAKATQRLEMQAVQREASEISARVEDAVDLLLSEAEELGALNLPSPRESLHREESSMMTRPARVVLDLLSGSRRKVDVFSQLSTTLLQSYRDFKQQCEEMTLKIEALTEDFGLLQREEPKECRNCRRCLAKLSEFSLEVDQLRSELQETEALLVDSRQAKEQLSKELGNATHRARELEKEYANSSLAVPEMLDLQEELKRAETTINHLEKQLRINRQDAESMKQGWREVQAEVENREKSLRKAQGIIKKLNSENENLVKDLAASEDLAETMKREAHQQEKSNRDAQIQLQSVEILHKTEVRLREEVQSLKSALETLKAESVSETNRAKDYIDELRRENESFQSQIEELETSILELDKEAKQQEETVKLHIERIADLEQALGQKMGEVEALHREIEGREEEHQAEIAHIKRIAENTIRNLQAEQGEESARSSRSPVRSVSPTLTVGKKASAVKKSGPQVSAVKELPAAFTDTQLTEALEREAVLQKGMREIVKKSSRFLAERVRTLETLEVALRPESERWIMRNEELETILCDFAGRINHLLKLNRDLQKVAQIKERQIEDQRKTAFQSLSLSEAFTRQLQAELTDTRHLLLEEVIPRGRELMGTQVDSTLKTVGELKKQCVGLEEKNEDLERDFSGLQEKERVLEAELRENEDKLIQRNSDLAHIRRLLSGLHYAYLTASAGKDPTSSPSLDVEDLLHDIEALNQDVELKHQDLLRLEEKWRELIASNSELQQAFEDDKDSLMEEIRQISDSRANLQAECNRMNDQGIAQKQALQEEIRRITALLEETSLQVAAIKQDRENVLRDKERIETHMQELALDVEKLQDELHSQVATKEQVLTELEDAQASLSRLTSKPQDKPPSDSLLTEAPFVRRDPDLRSTRGRSQDTGAIDRLLAQKEEYIQELEQRLETHKIDGLGTAFPSVFEETQGGDSEIGTLRRAKNKMMAYKRSFNKRLEEFETVLRLIEDSVAALEQGQALQVDKMPTSNPTLDTWLEDLLGKISDTAVKTNREKEREMRTFHTILTTINSADVAEEDKAAAVSLSNGLITQASPDMDFLAAQLIILVKKVIPGSDMRRSRELPREEVVFLSPFHARMLISAVSSLDSVELSLIDRKESLLQVSEELEGLTQSLSEVSIRGSDLPNKIAEMFSRFSLQFLGDLKRDLQAFAEALRDLKDVSRSNPGPGRGVSLWAFVQPTARRL